MILRRVVNHEGAPAVSGKAVNFVSQLQEVGRRQIEILNVSQIHNFREVRIKLWMRSQTFDIVANVDHRHFLCEPGKHDPLLRVDIELGAVRFIRY